jgi:hypothetical protein
MTQHDLVALFHNQPEKFQLTDPAIFISLSDRLLEFP